MAIFLATAIFCFFPVTTFGSGDGGDPGLLGGSGTCQVNGEGCNLITSLACTCPTFVQTCATDKGTCVFGSCSGQCQTSTAFYAVVIGVPLLIIGLLIWACCCCCNRSGSGGERQALLVVHTPVAAPIGARPPQGGFCSACGAPKGGRFCQNCGKES